VYPSGASIHRIQCAQPIILAAHIDFTLSIEVLTPRAAGTSASDLHIPSEAYSAFCVSHSASKAPIHSFRPFILTDLNLSTPRAADAPPSDLDLPSEAYSALRASIHCIHPLHPICPSDQFSAAHSARPHAKQHKPRGSGRSHECVGYTPSEAYSQYCVHPSSASTHCIQCVHPFILAAHTDFMLKC
jgi:hypothetical protein